MRDFLSRAMSAKDFVVKRRMVVLVIAIPAAAVLMSAVTVYVAVSTPEAVVKREAPPLSKTSWREQE